jgi:hypothetical protein
MKDYVVTGVIPTKRLISFNLPFKGPRIEHSGNAEEVEAIGHEVAMEYLRKIAGDGIHGIDCVTCWEINDVGSSFIKVE